MYRIGFYVLHCGLVLMLVGMFIYYIAGDKVLNVPVPVDNSTYSKIQRSGDETNPDSREDNYIELDFALGFAEFKVDKYDDGSDKFYDAKMILIRRGVAEPEYQSLRVNHPVRVNGWKIYLMNYEESTTGQVVDIMLKKNPGEYVTLAGIWMAIVGGFIMCLLRKRGAE